MKKTENLNIYLSNLAILNAKLHNLHWNVTGVHFMQIHKFTEALYEDAFQKFDDVAEQLKIQGNMPLLTLKDYLENATIKEVAGSEFSAGDVLKILNEDLSTMKKLATDIRNQADEANDFTTVAMLEDHVAYYDKNLWFIRSMEK